MISSPDYIHMLFMKFILFDTEKIINLVFNQHYNVFLCSIEQYGGGSLIIC